MKRMDLFKIGMWIVIGAKVGDFFGECISAFLDGTFHGIITGLASDGNKRTQRACDVRDFSYKKFDDHKKNESKKNNVQPIWNNLHDINEKEGGGE